MMLGARTAAFSGTSLRNPYVTNGLVAMWDGIWNGGVIGKHDGTMENRWIDCANGMEATTDCPGYGFGTLAFDGTYAVAERCLLCCTEWGAIADALNSVNFTVEFVRGHDDARGYMLSELRNEETLEIWDNGNNSIYFRVLGYGNVGHMGNGVTVGYGGVVESGAYTLSSSYSPDFSLAIRSYKNAVLKRSTDSTKEPSLSYPSGTAPLGVIGVGNMDHISWCRFTGRVAALRVYARALTADEIAANYAIDKARFNLP